MNPPSEENDPNQPQPEGDGQQPMDPAQYPEQPVDPAQYPQQPADPAQFPEQPPAEPSYEAYQELAPPPPPPISQPQQPQHPSAAPEQAPAAMSGGPARRRVPAAGRRAPRKKVARAGSARPGYRGGRPAGGRAPAAASGGGFMTVLLGLIAVAFLGAVVMVVLPGDLSGIKGYPAKQLDTKAPRNLLAESQAIMFDPGKSVEFTEEEVNNYLNHRIDGEQGGALGSLLKYEGTYVDFSNGTAEIYITRSAFGMPITMSSRIRIERMRSQVKWVAAGGTLGKINLSSSHLQPVMQVYLRMMQHCKDEVGVIQNMANIQFDEDKLILSSTL